MSDGDTKWKRILRYLADGNELTRFTAARIGDSALNSTVSNLQAKGVNISREPIVLEGRFGSIHCKRYWIEPDDRQKAFKLLGVA